MDLYVYTFVSVLVVSIVSLVGVFTLGFHERFLKKYIFVLVSLAVGALLGDAFIHLIPEAFEEIGNTTAVSLAVIGGILIFFILEKVLHWHHHDDTGEHLPRPIGKLILISDGIHNFIDGLIIGSSYLISIEVGIATTLAVVLHEIPQEISDFGILLHAGYTKKRALWLNFFSALLAVLGAGIALAFNEITGVFAMWLIPITAGGFIYIAMSDLIPELHKTKKMSHTVIQLGVTIIGIALMVLLLTLE